MQDAHRFVLGAGVLVAVAGNGRVATAGTLGLQQDDVGKEGPALGPEAQGQRVGEDQALVGHDLQVGMRRVAVEAHAEGGETVLELEETERDGLLIAVVLIGQSFLVKTRTATKEHVGLLKDLLDEPLAKEAGVRGAE